MSRADAPPSDQTASVLAVTTAEDGRRVDRILAETDTVLSRRRIQNLIKNGHLDVETQTVTDPAHKVKAGARLSLHIPASPSPRPEAEAQPLPVIHEDDSIIVIDKPADLVVHPGAGHIGGTLVNALIAHCGQGFIGTGVEQRAGIVHRLDKDTTGLLVAAKTPEAERELVAQFQAHSVGRRYTGVTWGCPSPTSGILTGAIGRSPVHRKKMAVREEGGRPATTHYRVREALCHGAAAVVAFTLETGRTHQIRVHMAHAGHALVGDPVYGGGGRRTQKHLPSHLRTAAATFPRQALHAGTLAFSHPITGERLHFDSSLPADLAKLIAEMRAS